MSHSDMSNLPMGFEPDTSILALRAARQIDLARRGKRYDKGDLHAFVQSLRTNEQAVSSVDLVKTLAPTDIGVMTRAASAYGGFEPDTLEALADLLDMLLGEISKPLDALEKDDLDKLIAFCVTLHNEMLSQKRSSQESRRFRSRYRV